VTHPNCVAIRLSAQCPLADLTLNTEGIDAGTRSWQIGREQAMNLTTSTLHLLAVNTSCANGFCQNVLAQVVNPLISAAQILIPVFVFIAALHKLMDHQTSGGAFVVELIVKGGGAFLVLQLVKTLFGVS